MKVRLFLITILFFYSIHLAQAAGFCVDDLGDGTPNGADCASTCDGSNDCSLRDAVKAANDNSGTPDTITFGVTGTITFTEADSLAINDDLIITGPGQDKLTIDANGLSRTISALFASVEIYNVTLTGGADSIGAGVAASIGTLLIEDSTVTGNNATQFGGGLHCELADCTLNRVTFSNNDCVLHGGGAYVTSGTLTVNNSTFTANTAQLGAGLEVNDTLLTLNNVTVSGNQATSHGGGILVNEGTLSLNNATITSNTADTDGDDDGDGGGLYLVSGTTTLSQNSIIAANHDASTSGVPTIHPDCSGPGSITSNGYNIVGNAEGCNGTPGVGDQVGDASQPLDPLLGELQDNGGATDTHSPLPGSPAIDTGNAAACTDGAGAALTTDQRAKTRAVDANGDGLARCDVGAYEIQIFVIDSLLDTSDAASGDESCADVSGNCTLRAAIQETNVLPGTQAATIAVTGSIALASTMTSVSDAFILNGSGADQLTIQGSGVGRVMAINGGTEPTRVEINSVSIEGGVVGALRVFNDDFLILRNCIIANNTLNAALMYDDNTEGIIDACVISDNTSTGAGGGINFKGSELMIQRSLFTNNHTDNDGGAVEIQSDSIVTVINSTISGNHADRNGGGFDLGNGETLNIINSTLVNNTADFDDGTDGDGGAIRSLSGSFVNIKSSILAGNQHRIGANATLSNCNMDVSVTSLGNNIEDGTDCGFTEAGDLQSTDPLLGTLADNGGLTLTHALLLSSPAIDAIVGDCEDLANDPITQDQRGFTRPVNTDCDIGAFEVGNCGDGVIDPGEACDDGAGLNSDTEADACRTDCSLPVCGDGVVDSGEACDDDNMTDGDGCTSLCEIEEPPADDSVPPADDDPPTQDDTSNNETQSDDEVGSSGCSLIRATTRS